MDSYACTEAPPGASALVDSRFGGNDDSKVIPAALSPRGSAGAFDAALTEDECAVAGTGGEIPGATAGTGTLTLDGFHGNDGWGGPGCAVRTFHLACTGIHTALTERGRNTNASTRNVASAGQDRSVPASDEKSRRPYPEISLMLRIGSSLLCGSRSLLTLDTRL